MDYVMYFLIGICAMLMVLSLITDSMPKRRRHSLLFMAEASALLLVSSKLAYIYNGSLDLLGSCLARTSKFLSYGLFLAIIYAFSQYLRDLFAKEGKMATTPLSLKYAEYVVFAGIAVLLLSQFTGIYYYYDAANVYHRTRWYFMAYVFPQLAILFQLVAIIRDRKNLGKNLVAPLALFIILPMIAGVAQFFVHGVSLTSMAIVGMTALLYCFSVFNTNKLARDAHRQTAAALAEAIDAKDRYTNGHSRRVAEYSVLIARKAKKSEDECEEIYLSGLLHDVGKIGVPGSIINKEGKLTDEEYEIIKTHPVKGKEILSKITLSPNLWIGANYHHERYDGRGYPEGLKGTEIPELARIIAVADAYDAMASKRSYRDVLPKEVIREEIAKGIGTQFDPNFGAIMLDLIDSDTQYDMREK